MLLYRYFKILGTHTGIDKIIHITVVLFTHFLYTRILKTDMIYSVGKNLFQYSKNVRALRAHQPWL